MLVLRARASAAKVLNVSPFTLFSVQFNQTNQVPPLCRISLSDITKTVSKVRCRGNGSLLLSLHRLCGQNVLQVLKVPAAVKRSCYFFRICRLTLCLGCDLAGASVDVLLRTWHKQPPARRRSCISRPRRDAACWQAERDDDNRRPLCCPHGSRNPGWWVCLRYPGKMTAF